LTVAVDAPRPRAALIGKYVQASPSGNEANIQLNDLGELPQDATLVFSLRSLSPATFAHDVSVDVATPEDAALTSLTLGNGGLTLENAQVAVATLNPARAFGPSAFGPLKFRVSARGVTGDWQPLASLVRLPVLKSLTCPATPELACKLTGSNLFLLDSVAGNPEFTHPVTVPDGFLGMALPVPHPGGGPLYVRLRDDPRVINATTLTVQELPVPADDAGRTAARHSAVTDAADTQTAPTAAPAPSAPQAVAPPVPTAPLPPLPVTTPPPSVTTPPPSATTPLPSAASPST
jgi:hypothetical protein